MDISCDLGTWLDSAVRNVPRGTLSWQGIPRRIYSASIDGRFPLATVRRTLYLAKWGVSMPGFVWDIKGDRGTPQTAALGMDTSPVRGFRTSKEAMRAVEQAYRALLNADRKPALA